MRRTQESHANANASVSEHVYSCGVDEMGFQRAEVTGVETASGADTDSRRYESEDLDRDAETGCH